MLKYTLVVLISVSSLGSFFTNLFSPEKKEKIEWLTIEEALERNEEEPRKIIIDFYTDWCGWCKKLDRNTFGHPDIAKYINKKYYAVKFDAEGQQSVEYKDKTFNAGKSSRPGRFGTHEFAMLMAARNDGRIGYPTITFLDEESEKITFVPSYLEPQQMDMVLKYFGEDHYKRTKFGVFEKTFKSRIK